MRKLKNSRKITKISFLNKFTEFSVKLLTNVFFRYITINKKGGETLKFQQVPYWNKNGEKQVNCYRVYISKQIAKEAGIENGQEVTARAEKGKIIIEGVK